MIYLAYGSNLHIEQMKKRCPAAEVLGTSVLHGYRLVFNGVATIEPDPDRSVPVLLWDIKPSDERPLDRYEGYPHLYRRETVQVELNGKTVDAMVYIMNNKGIRPPSPYYYDVIRLGYEMNGLDTAILEQARNEAMTEA
ncbi:MAG TPA: gamma-glutamylcyclotransferase [Ruminococcus sp.]|nr:gamma-glutamylcyclotransferase [Ruminococcus sp.]